MYAREEICVFCGEKYLFRTGCKEGYKHDGAFKPICPLCRASMRKREEQERENKELESRKKKAEDEYKEYLERLKTWNVVPIGDVSPCSDNALYILGNGFDLMHRVPSSYYHFRDSMGKGNTLRNTLETYITVDNLWADFENALAHFNVAAMANEHMVDMWLDSFGAYKENSGVAEYYMSVETSASPIATVVELLPERFRKWVNSLKIGTTDRPLKNMFVIGGKVLNFNYTEFVENLYGVSKENVCYIHGCRAKQKGKQNEPLILGHLCGASNKSFDVKSKGRSCLRGYRRAFVEMAQRSVIEYISEYDEYLTKDTKKIIEKHEAFFSSLSSITTIIAIGHSFSETDHDYFNKIKSSIGDIHSVQWYFGCYGLRDLVNLEKLLNELNIDKSDVEVFRTDIVKTTPLPVSENISAEKHISIKTLCKSKDEKWVAERIENNLYISQTADNSIDYAVTIPSGFKRAFFVRDDRCLIVVIYGVYPGVLLFGIVNNHWQFIGELNCDHQHLLVPRLKHVFITEDNITFVYNNRIRKYSLIDGVLICNDKITDARNNHYDGEEVTDMFLRNSK